MSGQLFVYFSDMLGCVWGMFFGRVWMGLGGLREKHVKLSGNVETYKLCDLTGSILFNVGPLKLNIFRGFPAIIN